MKSLKFINYRDRWFRYKIILYTSAFTASLIFTGILLIFAYHEIIENEEIQFVDQVNIAQENLLDQLHGASTVLHAFQAVLSSSNDVALAYQVSTKASIHRMGSIKAAINLPIVHFQEIDNFILKQKREGHQNYKITQFDSQLNNLIAVRSRPLYLPVPPESLTNKKVNLPLGFDLASLPNMKHYIQEAIKSGEVEFAPYYDKKNEPNSYLAFLVVYRKGHIPTTLNKRYLQAKSVIMLMINAETDIIPITQTKALSLTLRIDNSPSNKHILYKREGEKIAGLLPFKELTNKHLFHVNNQPLFLEINKPLYLEEIDLSWFIFALTTGGFLTICLFFVASIAGHHHKNLLIYNRHLLDNKAKMLSREAYLKAILENATDGIMTLDNKGIIKTCNSSALTIFGYALDEFIDHHVSMLIPKRYIDAHHNDISALLEKNRTDTTEEKKPLEWQVIKSNGTVFTLELSITKVKIAEEVMYVSIMRDITLRKQAEKKEHRIKLEHAKKEAEYNAKNSFFAMISHEMRTPLASIIGYAESLFDANISKEHNFSAVSTIIRNGNHLLHIINEILDLSKINSSDFKVNLEPTCIISVTEDVKELIILKVHEKGLVFNLKYHFPLPKEIEADAVRIKQILCNLIGNAIKFTDHGSITVEVKFNIEESKLHFSIIDTGIGIPKEQQKKIFEHYQQSDYLTSQKHGGTGLGLPIAQKLAQLHKGEIKVTSEPNKGSHFELCIAVDPTKTELITALPQRFINKIICMPLPFFNTHKLKGKVLVAEDNPDMQGLIAFYLKSLGVEFITVSDGRQAVEVATEQPFDLILMDMQMPIMNGIQAVKKLRDANHQKPIIMLTANAMDKDRIASQEAGCNDFLPKPIKRTKFTAILEKYLKAAVTTDGNDGPLESELKEMGDDFNELILKFINRLPETMANLHKAQNEWDWNELESIIHQLKGIGGEYGYPQITEIACGTEFQVLRKSKEGVNEGLQELDKLTHRITAAA
jgi:PAS domain S-box-containing protein